jgi:hypothetical protein
VVDTVPRVVVNANDYAILVEDSFVVVTEGKECESPLVSIVVFADTGYTRIRFTVEDRLLVEV